MKKINYIFLFILQVFLYNAQIIHVDSLEKTNNVLDSLYIMEVEAVKGKDKVLHAEPLFIDLIRDLGARKGEREWNVGLGMTDRKNFDLYTTLIEYEFAPIDRLGLEVELPFSFYYPTDKDFPRENLPQNKLNSLKLAGQYSFYVNEKISTSFAFGYLHEFELTHFKNYGKETLYHGNVFNPFIIGAKRWGDNFHTLVYSGPVFQKNLSSSTIHALLQINSNFHYMIPGTRNFIGLEFNKEISENDFDMTVRPQMRLEITHHFLVGIVTGIPIKRENERFSTFIRLIYEPKQKK